LSGAHILLPTSSIDWIIYQPDNVLSVVETHRENLQTDLTFVHPFVVANPLHHETIKNELTRQLGALTTDIIDELSAAFDDIWGTDAEQWKDVCIFETIMQIVARTSNRVFVGPSLCRDGRMLEHAIGFATAIALASAVLGQIPRFLRPLAAPIITRPNQKHTKAFAAILRPEIERRQRCLNDQDWGSDKEAGETEPNDFLQWTVRRARESPFSVERDPDIIAERLLAVNFAAIHTSTFSVTNAVFDLVSSDPSLGYIEQLRDEAASTLARDNGLWTKQGISKMYKIDSTFRESSRLGSFLGVGLMRTVMSPDGVTAPNGTFCPYGSRISVPTNGVHNDPALYPDAAVYQPFRFSSQRGSLPTDATETKTEVLDTEDYLKKANLSFVSTSPAYHPFGHGRHACPGRFFAANELKLMLAYMVLNYDFEMIPERPESKWMGATLVPPMKATVRVRRRV
jgi:cytochrome P450